MKDQQGSEAAQKIPLEINGQQFMDLLNHGSALVIDVREVGEVPVINVKNHLQIPMSSFHQSNFEKITAQNLIMVCQHGVRSLAAAEILQEKFIGTKNIYSLKGGVVRWPI